MNKLLLTLCGSFFILNANAAQQSYELEAVEKDLDSKICITGAQQGIKAAKSLAKESGIYIALNGNNFYCNNQTLGKFVNKYGAKTSTEKALSTPVTQLFAASDNTATDICLKAAENGYQATKAEHKNLNSISCNGQSVKKFAKKYSVKSAI